MEFRKLSLEHYDQGYFELLAQLTVAPKVDRDTFRRRLEAIDGSGAYEILVAEMDKMVVGSATLLVERKMLRNCGLVGHIEDVVVDKSARGTGVGRELIERLATTAKELGCYKVILDCGEQNVGFYEKCGFSRKEVQMALYF